MNISQNNNIVYINTLQKQDTDNVLFYMNINVFEIVFKVVRSLIQKCYCHILLLIFHGIVIAVKRFASCGVSRHCCNDIIGNTLPNERVYKVASCEFTLC